MFYEMDQTSLVDCFEKLMGQWKGELQASSPLDRAVRTWLLNPGPQAFMTLESELAQLTDVNTSSVASLRWLSFFDGHSDRKLFQKLRHFHLDGQSEDFENQFISRLQRLRGNHHTQTSSTDNLLLRSILKAIQSSPVPTSGLLLINLETWEITRHEQGNLIKIVSRPMSLAFELFKSHDSMSFTLFAEFALEVRTYEDWLHDHRILNLLSRMRRQFSLWVSVQTRSQRIYAEVKRDRIEFLTPTPHEKIRASVAWKNFLQPPHETVSHAYLRARLPGTFTRIDLESAARVSRSSANRMLSEMKKRKLLRVLGGGKKIKYRFLPIETAVMEKKVLDRS